MFAIVKKAGFALMLTAGTTVPAIADVSLPGARAYPENVAVAADGSVYISNIAEGGVLRMKKGGVPQPWIKPQAFGTGTTYGVAADVRTGQLWVCSNDLSTYGLASSASGKSSLKAFDLETGKGQKTLEGPGECNDIAIAEDGALYITDTAKPQIFRLAPGGSELEIFATDPRFAHENGGLDGIAIGADGHLYVNILGSGKLFRVTVGGEKPGTVTELTLSRPLSGPDGMRHEGGNRFLVTTAEGDVRRLIVTGDQVTVEIVRDGLVEPTGIAILGDTALVSEGQFSFIFDDSKKGKQPNLPFRLRTISLKPKQ